MAAQVKDDEAFISRVEGLIEPAEVCDLLALQRFKRLLPAALFKRLLLRTSRKFPQIGFVIEPYCLFLFFRLRDLDRARAFLPPRYELVPTRITEGDEPGYFHGMGVFNARGSTFWGTRLESYLIARDRETGLMSWIFMDILSDTIISSPKYGVGDPNTGRCMHTTDPKGNILLDVEEAGGGRRLRLKASVNGGVRTRLDQPLWIGGNNSVAFTEKLAGGDEEPFAVIFDPAEVETALELPPADVELRENTIAGDLAEPVLFKALCFPFAQHYVADSPGQRTFVRDAEDMVAKYDALAARGDLRTFTARGLKRLIALGMALSALVTIALAIALVLALSR